MFSTKKKGTDNIKGNPYILDSRFYVKEVVDKIKWIFAYDIIFHIPSVFILVIRFSQ